MKKILYCMHISWNWIKQRPQYIAEELSNNFEVIVFSDYQYREHSEKNGKSNKPNIKFKNFYKIPLLNHNKKLIKLNYLLKKIYMRRLINKIKPDYIYVMSPDTINYLPQQFSSRLIYDCMDDMLEFHSEVFTKKEIENNEKKLINKSDLVLVSSENLKRVLYSRYNIKDKKIILVRNGYSGKILNVDDRKDSKTNNSFTLCYFGTISSWFNFDFILKSLEEFNNLNYLIVGPVQEGNIVPKHHRIKYTGPVQHDKLFDTVKTTSAFIMPFEINKLIESVDPVKLYEYINFNKNILCVKYREVERFDDFVYFYTDYSSFRNQIKLMMKEKETKYSPLQREKFLQNNTWAERCRIIEENLKKL